MTNFGYKRSAIMFREEAAKARTVVADLEQAVEATEYANE